MSWSVSPIPVTITVDTTATLALNGAAINGGTVTNEAAASLDLTGTAVLKNGSLGNSGQINVSGTGNELDSETVTSNHALEILAAGVLTLDQATMIANGGGTVTVDGTATLTLNGATITGGTVTNNGTILVSGAAAIDSATVGNVQLTVDSGKTLTLDRHHHHRRQHHRHRHRPRRFRPDADAEWGYAFSGGAITNAGTIEISGTGSIDNDTFSNAQLTIDSGQILTLDGTTITGGDITDTGTVHVDSGQTLTLSGVALSGGAITNAGTIEIAGTGSIENDTFGNAQLTIDSGQTLTLEAPP